MPEVSKKIDVLKMAIAFLNEPNSSNYIKEEATLRPDIAGMRIYDDPLVGYAAADDSYLLSLIDNKEANLKMSPPSFWLPSARTVVSLFFPFTERVKKSNRGGDEGSFEWMHARIEGQQCIMAFIFQLKDALIGNGYEAVVPTADPRFWSAAFSEEKESPAFTSNWSERHAAYAAGLGTFALSKGLITEKGIAGRFVSLVTSLEVEPSPRLYEGLYDYCCKCGKCAVNCPVDAIDIKSGKSHPICAAWVDQTGIKYKPYYGCGKCQVGVPCESTKMRAVKA